MVKLARVWRTVPSQRACRASYPAPYKTIPNANRLHLQMFTTACAGDSQNEVKYLEHVQAIITLNALKRGDIQVYLISPSGTYKCFEQLYYSQFLGTRSTLLAKRVRDTSRTGFRDWAFMSTHYWSEQATGTWTLEVDNDGWDGKGFRRFITFIFNCFRRRTPQVGPGSVRHNRVRGADWKRGLLSE